MVDHEHRLNVNASTHSTKTILIHS